MGNSFVLSENSCNASTVSFQSHQQNSLVASLEVLSQEHLPKGGNMQEHIQKFFEVNGELKNEGCEVSDRVLSKWLLASLGEEYHSLVTAIEAWPYDRLTSENVKQKLLEEWYKMNGNGSLSSVDGQPSSSGEETFAYQAKAKDPNGFCGESEHFSGGCELLLENNMKKEPGEKNSTVLLVECVLVLKTSDRMTSQKELFCHLDVRGNTNIIISNETRLRIDGDGTVRFDVIIHGGETSNIAKENKGFRVDNAQTVSMSEKIKILEDQPEDDMNMEVDEDMIDDVEMLDVHELEGAISAEEKNTPGIESVVEESLEEQMEVDEVSSPFLNLVWFCFFLALKLTFLIA